MSDQESSRYLTLLVVLGPLVALANQGLTYSVNMWACGHHAHGTMHIVPLLCFVVAASATFGSFRAWRRVGTAGMGGSAAEFSSARLLAAAGIAIGLFSTALILAQWAAIAVFDPCMK
jgi:hypothetical protein